MASAQLTRPSAPATATEPALESASRTTTAAFQVAGPSRKSAHPAPITPELSRGGFAWPNYV